VPHGEAEGDVSQCEPGGDEPPQVVALEKSLSRKRYTQAMSWQLE